MIGASLVTAVSEIPWNGPIGGVQVGLVDGEIVLNPTQEQRKVSDLALTVAATMDKIVMIEPVPTRWTRTPCSMPSSCPR